MHVFFSQSCSADTHECLLNESWGQILNERPIWLGALVQKSQGEERGGEAGQRSSVEFGG